MSGTESTLSASAVLFTENITVAAVNAGAVTVALSARMQGLTHVFIGFTFVNGSDVVTTPGAGTMKIESLNVVNPENAAEITGAAAIDATVIPVTLAVNDNVKSLEFSTSVNITTATNIIVRVLANAS